MEMQRTQIDLPPDSSVRATPEAVAAGRQKVLLDPSLVLLLEALPDYVLILNQERQVLAANTLLLQAFGLGDGTELLGKRPGEALGCIFSREGEYGCGSGTHCTVCGALHSILESQRQSSAVNYECHVTLDRKGGEALDLEVISTPALVDGMHLTVCVLKDISAEKRRDLLERVFFHDVLNTAGGIYGIASLLQQGDVLEPAKDKEYRQWLVDLIERLIDEINQQKKLLAAELGEFRPELGVVDVAELLGQVQALYASHDVAIDRQLVLGNVSQATILSDPSILRRILGNLVKNALEACEPGEIVTMAVAETAEWLTFSVHNPGVIPAAVQLQLFQRSFSTKGEGRGIGTYSIKLFGERYLHGKVGFVSKEPEGTTFTFSLPKQI